MKSIMFLSRELTDAKTRYWPTEMKIIALIWIIKKIQHLIKTIEHPIIIYIDHSATIAIAQQFSLNTISVIKVNLRLIRSSKYLQRFKLNVRHIKNKTNTIPDALSRLVSSNGKKETEENVLIAMTTSVYSIIIIHMADEFKTKIISNYANYYLKIIDFIIANNELNFYTTNFFYVFKRGFLYYKNFEKELRLCISNNMTKNLWTDTWSIKAPRICCDTWKNYWGFLHFQVIRKTAWLYQKLLAMRIESNISSFVLRNIAINY